VSRLFLASDEAPPFRRSNEDSSATMHAAVEANVRAGMHAAQAQSAIVGDALAARKLKVAGGVYDLHSGKVTLL